MINHLISKVARHIDLNADEIALIRDSFKQIEYKANEFLLQGGNVANKFYYVIEGLVRVFHMEDEKEINTVLVADNSFVSAFLSFIEQKPSMEFIQALEPTTTLAITYEKMQNLYENIRNWDKIGRIIAEHNFRRMAGRVVFLQMKSGKNKYLSFLESADPKVIQRTPSIHIASYLGMAPESLSRIRKNR